MSIIHSSEIINFPKKLTVKNVVKKCFFKKFLCNEDQILISEPSNLCVSPIKREN